MPSERIASTNVVHHEIAGHNVEDLPYDPDLGDNQWRCVDCDLIVEVPGWRW
jgi:hypothetical protein